MDGFEIRLQLVSILRKLSSSQTSIQTTTKFLLKHKNKYGEDLWDCVIEEAEKVNLNARINILYLVDTLLFTSATAQLTDPGRGAGEVNYGGLIRKDIRRLVEIVVPTSFHKKGLLNLMSTAQVLRNWRSQLPLIDRFIDLPLLNDIDAFLLQRKSVLAQALPDSNGAEDELLEFSKKDILGRIDDDRERHKRLRERMWALPVAALGTLSAKVAHPTHPATTYPLHRSATLLHTSLAPNAPPPLLQADLTLALECDQLLLANQEDSAANGLELPDWTAIRFENSRCFGPPPLPLPAHDF